MPIRLLFLGIIALVAFCIGLILRRLLVRRLKNTILDTWLIQTLGIIVIFPPLILATVSVPYVLNNSLISGLWDSLLLQIHTQDVTSVSWGLIETVLVMMLGIGVARTLMRFAIRGLGENRIDINIRTLIGRICYILTIIIAIFWLLSIWHIAIDLPVAVLGTLTVAFTFAIQDILKDLVAGFYILMERPFHIGDLITIGDQTNDAAHTGRVEDVQIRATRLRLVSGEQVMVPNTLVFSGIVINNTYYDNRRATITVTIPQDEFHKDETPQRIITELSTLAPVLPKPEPTVMISGYSGNLVTLTLHFWTESAQIASISEVMYTLRTVLPNADLTVVEAAGNV